jgi:tRNA threonylcarbamoyladenosine biosynthesis protein TsaE
LAQEEEEAQALGAVLAVEWPERLAQPVPLAWRVSLEHRGDGRRAVVQPPGSVA